MIDHYEAEVTSANDYYPGGMGMPGRTFNSNSYRFGFQNQEIDRELWCGAISFEYRVEDPRLVRFFSLDPLAADYPYNSPYAFGENRLIDGVELEGLEWAPTKDKQGNTTDYDWVGFGLDGKTPEGTVGSATLRHGDATYTYGSNAEARTGSLSISSSKNPGNSINVFIFKNNTAQWVQNLNGTTSIGDYATEYYRYGSIKPYQSREDQDVSGFTGQDFALKRGVNQRVSLGWTPQAIETDGLGPLDYIGPGELKLLFGGTGAGIKTLLKGGLSFKDYKAARGGTRTLGFIQTTNNAGNTVLQRVSKEYAHVFITQRTQRALGLPNWLVNNQLNVWRMNTIQHAITDPSRFQFLRFGLKSEVGLFKRYNLFTTKFSQ